MDKTKETVAGIIEELKRTCLVKQVVVAECDACENDCHCFSNNTGNNRTFEVHTNSDKYKYYLFHLGNYTELEEQDHSTSARAVTK